MIKVILLGVEPDDFILACRAAKWLIKQPSETKDGILNFGDLLTDQTRHAFYVRRNKASITVRRMA